MAERIIKDIRYSESEVANIAGNTTPDHFGKLFKATIDSVAIGQRIARKLNELKFISGSFDHIDLNFTTSLPEGYMKVSDRKTVERIKYVDCGLSPATFNSQTDKEKDIFLIESTFASLKLLYTDDPQKISLIEQVENEITQFGKQLKIHYKTKETSSYKIVVSYQIRPVDALSRGIIEYTNKKKNSTGLAYFDLQFYDDIYPLIDTISVRDNNIILQPKISFRADLYNERYKTPMEFPIAQLEISQ